MTDIADKREESLLKRRVQYNTYLQAEQKIIEASAALEDARQKKAKEGDEVWGYLVAKREEELKKAEDQAKKEKAAWEDLIKETKDYDKVLEGMSKNINVGALTNDSNGSNKKEAEEYANYMKNIERELTKTRIALIEDRRKAEVASVENTYKENINKIKPDFVWIGLGAPKQEKWMAEHQGKIDAQYFCEFICNNISNFAIVKCFEIPVVNIFQTWYNVVISINGGR
jgi:hypothetical protein